MRKSLLKAFLFILIIVAMVSATMFAFRSEIPLLWLGSLATFIIILILFPYEGFFRN